MRGCIDQADRGRIAGWVQDVAVPLQPVSLLITVDDTLIARVMANRYREDLAVAGIGHGRHAFEVAIDRLTLPADACPVAVCREEDGLHVPGSPVLLRRARALDQTMRSDIAALLETPCDDDELRVRIDFLATQTDRLLQLRSERLSHRSERLAARPHAGRWVGRAAQELSRDRRRALVVDRTAPVAGRDAGANAVLSHIASLRRLGYEVTLVPADLAPPADPAALDQLGVTVCAKPWFASVEEVLRRQAGGFDLVYLHRVEVAAGYSGLVRQYLPKARLIYSVADLRHLRVQRQAELEDRPELLAVARRERSRELLAAWSADAVLTHSSVEAALLRRELPADRVHLVRWAVPPHITAVPFLQRNGIAFLAGFGHPPNVDAAFWLVEAIMPLVWAQAPGLECVLAGSSMPDAIRALARPGVTVLGRIAELSAVFDRVRATVATLAYGAGIKGKVLDSMAAGVPCACTPIAAEGIDLPALLSAQVSNDPAGLAAIILRLHNDAALNAACADAGLRYVAEHLSEAGVDAALGGAIGGAGGCGAARSGASQ